MLSRQPLIEIPDWAAREYRSARSRERVLGGDRDWFKFQNKTGDVAEVRIYDEIGFFGITAADFLSELDGVSAPSINLHLNSPGGEVFDGLAIYNSLLQHPATVNVIVDSIAASITSVIAMAGDTITMARGSMLMIHEPFTQVIGNASYLRQQAKALDVMGRSIASAYAARAGGDIESWLAVMADETWYEADAAVESGLADKIAGVASKATFNLSIFRNAPRPTAEPPSEPEVRNDTPDATASTQWRNNARLMVAAAELEVTNGNAHRAA